ncbi:MAG: Spy/CpxP family protein refolding chaperone [Bacteroidales bacterium]
MKTMKRITVLTITGIFLLMSSSAFSQKGKRPGYSNKGDYQGMYQNCERMIPNLTEEQQEQIKELRLEHMKAMQNYQNELQEKRASLRTLQTQDNPDMSKINNKIEELGELRTEMHKESAQHRQEIRKMLDDEQKLIFDKHSRRYYGRMHHKGSSGNFGDYPKSRMNRR